MDFFGRQDEARRSSAALGWLFAAAVLGVVLAINVAVVIAFGFDREGKAKPFQGATHLWVTIITVGIIACGCMWQWLWLRGGGRVVAESLGGRLVEAGERDGLLRQYHNVVEEMSIASGVPMPAVYVLPHEGGINAFAAGWSGNDAVVAVTRGAVERLTRDELQGVVAHEFSHLLNGDVRLNMRLIGLVFGLELIGVTGRVLMRIGAGSGASDRDRKGNALPLLLFGLAVMLIGYLGWFAGQLIRAAFNRSREHLADAHAVQFTRNTVGLANAFKKIGHGDHLGYIAHENAEMAGHLYAVNGMKSSWLSLMATHPPIEERIRLLDPHWDGTWTPAPPLQALGDVHAPSRAQRNSASAIPAMGLAGGMPALGLAGSMPVQAMADSVGEQPSADTAALWIAGLNSDLRAACDDPFSARAVVLAAIADAQPARARMVFDVLDKALDQSPGHRQLLREVRALHPLIHHLGPAAPSTVILRCSAALRRLVVSQRNELKRWLELAVNADSMVSLREVALRTMVLAMLRETPNGNSSSGASPSDDDAAATVLGALARLDEQPQAAFANGWKRYQPLTRNLPAAAMLTPTMVGVAIDRVARTPAAARRRVLDAAAWCAAHDGRLSAEEAETLRALALAFALPVPPLVAPVPASR